MLAFLTFLGSPLGKVAGWMLIALVLVGTVLGVKAEWDAGQAAIHQVAAIKKVSVIETSAVKKADLIAAKTDTAAQAKIVIRTRTILKKVPTYVSTSAPCIPWGVVRLHDAAVLGVDPSTLQAPASEPDDACSTITASALVDTVVANYGIAQANAQQLNDLEADIAARAQAVAPAAPSGSVPLAGVTPPM